MSKQFAEFLMGDLFTVENGKKHPVKDRVDGDMPLVSTSSLCRGISQYITVPNEKGFKTHKNVLTIAYSGSVGETFYHPYEVFVGETVMTLLLKEEFGTLNNLRGQYLQTVIRKKMNRYSYSSKVKISDVRNTLTITLPVTDESAGTESPEPDWEYMEAYIKEIEEKYLDSVVKYNKRNGEILDTLYPDYHGSAPEAYDYAEFRVGDVFEITPTKWYKDKPIVESDVIAPQVSNTTQPNGVTSFEKYPANNDGNVITFSDTTVGGETLFYQPVDFIGYSHVQKMVPLNFELNQSIAHYVISAFRKAVVGKFNYAAKFNRENASNTYITLPTTPTGEPDWVFMEDYIDYIAGGGRNRIARYVQHKKNTSSSS